MTQIEPEPSNSTPDGSYPSEPSTSDPGGFSDATGPVPTITSSTKSQVMDLESLSPRAEAIRFLLADEMSDGYNLTTLASELGLSPSSASALLAELKNELLLQTGPLPPLSSEEYEALKDSINSDGVRVPVIIGRHMLIDGRHRIEAARELGLDDIPVLFVDDLTAEQEHDLAVALNASRRQLTREQKNSLIRAELRRDWSRSSRFIASICGSTHQTVELVRRKMREEAEARPTEAQEARAKEQVVSLTTVPESEKFTPPSREEDIRIGADDVPQMAYAGRVALPDTPLGYIFAETPGRYAIYRDGEGLRAERVA